MRKAQGTKHFKVVDGKKICSLCMVNKPVYDFFRNSKSGAPQSRCKKCHTKLNKENRLKRESNPLKARFKPKSKIPFWKQGRYGVNPITMQLSN